MKTKSFAVFAVVAGALVLAGAARAQDALRARGAYIVNGVAGCNDCHSPRTRQGQLVRGRELSGSPLLFVNTVPMPWANAAPKIRGLPEGWTEGQLARFLQNGKRPNGSEARPPMPPYRMNAADARAVAAYIHSLK